MTATHSQTDRYKHTAFSGRRRLRGAKDEERKINRLNRLCPSYLQLNIGLCSPLHFGLKNSTLWSQGLTPDGRSRLYRRASTDYFHSRSPLVSFHTRHPHFSFVSPQQEMIPSPLLVPFFFPPSSFHYSREVMAELVFHKPFSVFHIMSGH